jgi:hypothetical protein
MRFIAKLPRSTNRLASRIANRDLGVNENSFGGEALGAVAGDGVAVVEMTTLNGVEFDLAVVVETCRKPTIGMDALA